MKGNGLFQLLMMCMLGLSLDSCIYDQYPGRKQYALTVEYVDSLDRPLEDSVASLDSLNCFVNGIYQKALTKEPDGKYRYAFLEDSDIAFVAIDGKNPSEYTITPPFLGCSIHNSWLQMKLPIGEETPEPSPIFYGSVYTHLMSTSHENVFIKLKDIRAQVRVVANNILAKFGAGNYRVTLENCCTGVAFDGTPCGPLASYEMPGKIYPDGNYRSISRYILPTGEMPLRVKIYKEDGKLLFESNTDVDGKPLLVKPGSNNVIIIQFYYTTETTIKVVPFEEVGNETIFP